MSMLTTKQITAKYGQPGDIKNLTTIPLPYPMRIAWDMKTKVEKMTCHKLVAAQLTAIFKELKCHYGLAKLQELGIDIFGGCFNFRKMRGGSDWSRHSWAIAYDLDPEHNTLNMGANKARFAKEEYKPMMAIVYANGFVNQGIEKGFDYMHFEVKE